MTDGEGVGLTLGVNSGERDGVSLGVGKAKVGEATGVGDSLGEGVDVRLGVALKVGLGVGVGVGMMSAQRYNSVLAPPSSWTSFSQRARILSKSGGPKGVSAVPGKIR